MNIQPLFFINIDLTDHAISQDHKLFLVFIREFEDSPHTYRTYGKEVERFLLWCINNDKHFIKFNRNDVFEYNKFITSSKLLENRCGRPTSKIKKGKINPSWRPFLSALSEKSAERANLILKIFFNYLVKSKYINENPFCISWRKKYIKTHKLSNVRCLEISEIKLTLDVLADSEKNASNSFMYTRGKYIILLLFYTGMRVSEAAAHKMSDILLIDNKYYIRITGKGKKIRDIPLPSELLKEIAAFRKKVGFLTEFPSYNEKTPLIPQKCLKKSIDVRSIHDSLKFSFGLAANKLEGSDQRISSKLRAASAHWLRHTYVTNLLKNGVSPQVVQQNVGHTNINTTMIYSNLSQDERHTATQKLSLNMD